MSNKNLIVNTQKPKPGILEREMFCYCDRNGNRIRNGNIDRTGDGNDRIFRMAGISDSYRYGIFYGISVYYPGGNYESGRRTLLDCNKFIRCKCRRTGGVYTKLVTPILNSSFALALGLYVNNLLPGNYSKSNCGCGNLHLICIKSSGNGYFCKG